MALLSEPSSPNPPTAEPARARTAWQRFAEAATVPTLLHAWLEVLCGELVAAEAGVVLLADADGSYVPAATWPAGHDLSALADIARRSLRERSGVTELTAARQWRCAYPLVGTGGALLGSVVVDLGAASDEALARCRQMLHWGAAWLVDLASQRELQTRRRQVEQTGFVLDLLLGTLGAATLREAQLALVNRLASRFDARQVLLAVPRGSRLRLAALSHAAVFDERSSLVHLALEAMHESLDQCARIVLPGADGAPLAADLAHRRYAEAAHAGALASLPLEQTGVVVAVVMLERAAPFDADELAFLDTLALALAPAAERLQRSERGLVAHARHALGQALRQLGDGSHPGLKLVAGTAALCLAALALWPATFRVAAPATVEGQVQRIAPAPFQGFIREAPARAGDIVHTGQVLALLEDKELQLERLRWDAELEVARRKESEAMSAGNRVNQRLAAAQAAQARAQLDLAEEKLARVAVTAPLDGIVVKGDLSQQLGSPVEQGQVLFEIAPLDAWRVVLKVDERDIGHVCAGQAGELVLASLPGRRWPLKVRRVTPVSVAEEGRNFFRVEAELGETAPVLSPNMEGVAKLAVEPRSLLWIWTRPLVEWLRLAAWKAMP